MLEGKESHPRERVLFANSSSPVGDFQRDPPKNTKTQQCAVKKSFLISGHGVSHVLKDLQPFGSVRI